jgi:hypothetical protein
MGENAAINVQIFASGYCEAHGKVANPSFGKGTTKFYATWALIHLPDTKELRLSVPKLPQKPCRRPMKKCLVYSVMLPLR